MMDQQNPEQSSQLAAYEVRFLCKVLQQLQVLFGSQPTVCDPSLADLVDFIHSVQLDFGREASLEQVIHQQRPESPSQPAAYEVRFFCTALRQIHVLLGSQQMVCSDPSLADVVHLIHAAQTRFGLDESLELAIQALVVEDTERQVGEEIVALVRNRRQVSVVACQAVSILTSLPEVLAL